MSYKCLSTPYKPLMILVWLCRRRGKSNDSNLEWPQEETVSTLQPGSKTSWFNKCVSCIGLIQFDLLLQTGYCQGSRFNSCKILCITYCFGRVNHNSFNSMVNYVFLNETDCCSKVIFNLHQV